MNQRIHSSFPSVWLLIFLTAWNVSRAETEALTTASEVRSLSRHQAERGLPVRIRGTVILQIGRGRVFNIHDGDECLAVHVFKAIDQGIWQGGPLPESDTQPGSLVEIEGITDPAGYVPVIVPKTIRRVGESPLPPAKRITMEQLISGAEASQLVEVEGVVQKARCLPTGFEMDLMVEGELCDVKIQNEYGLIPENLVDARIRLRGCSSPIFNLRSEATRMRLLSQSVSDITILRTPPKDPFLAPRVPLKGLLPFSKHPDRFHRKVTQGVVNFAQPGKFFFLQDTATGIRVDSSDTGLSVGDQVEVSGFIDTSRHIASMTEAVTRRIGTAALPAAVPMHPGQLLHPPVANPVEPVTDSDPFGSLVRLTGKIRNSEWKAGTRHTRLLIDSEGVLFPVFLSTQERIAAGTWAEETEVAVTGVCELEFEPGIEGPKSPVVSGFTLWSRNPADIMILRKPSWWTPLRLTLALGGTLAGLALSLIWAYLLRRQVTRQMGVISGKVRNEAVSNERNRMARDLHDTLEQQLAGVSLQLEGSEETVLEDPQAALDSLALARRMLEFTRTEARRSVWDLRSHVLEKHGLETAIRTMAEGSSHPSGPGIEVKVAGDAITLPTADSFNLLRMCQEALANALKHARASHIVISLEYAANLVRLTISDDGGGFEPGMLDHSESSHFGVFGMRERAAKIGADLTITGKPGEGCVVTITLPRKPPNQSRLS